MNYINIRKAHYKTQRKLTREANADIDDWLHSPYNALKSRIIIELSALFVFFIQHTPIKPNWISLSYALSGVIGGILLSSESKIMIVTGVIVFFFKGIFDWSDGLLARLKKQTSELGDVLDSWGGLVGSFSFLIGLGMYLYNSTQEIHFVYCMILIITTKALDIKDYTYHHLMYKFYKNKKSIVKSKNIKNKISNKENEISGFLIFLKNFFQSFLDDRARTVDFIGLIILIEIGYDKIILSNFIYYLILFRLIMIFLGGFYLVYFKKFIEKLVLKIK